MTVIPKFITKGNLFFALNALMQWLHNLLNYRKLVNFYFQWLSKEYLLRKYNHLCKVSVILLFEFIHENKIVWKTTQILILFCAFKCIILVCLTISQNSVFCDTFYNLDAWLKSTLTCMYSLFSKQASDNSLFRNVSHVLFESFVLIFKNTEVVLQARFVVT